MCKVDMLEFYASSRLLLDYNCNEASLSTNEVIWTIASSVAVSGNISFASQADTD